MAADALHTEAKYESILVDAVELQTPQVTTLAKMSALLFTCVVFSAPAGGGTGSQQTILHEEQ